MKEQKYPIGSYDWPKFLRRLVDQVTFSHFGPTARIHDKGAALGSQVPRDENDRVMLKGFLKASRNQRRWALRQYLICMSYVFYGLVRLNPGHYKGTKK